MLSARSFFRFLVQTLKAFRANQGLLLSGAIAYYTLLSIIPLFTLLLLALSHVVEEQYLLEIVENNLMLIVGEQAHVLVAQFASFLKHREMASWIVLLVLLFFSSMAFSMLENAMSVIFFHRVKIYRRHFLVSAIIPYIYIVVLGLGILLVSFISGALQVMQGESITLFMWTFTLDDLTSTLLYLLGVAGLILLLTSLYLVMPFGRISYSHALLGSLVAALLWEIARHILVWYFSTLSMVNLIYGSLATAVVALLFLEVAAMSLLFGAQVIAEYERVRQGVSDEEEMHT